MQKKENITAAIPTAQPPILMKQIGQTRFIVSVHFSPTSKETMPDKIIRLIQRDAADIA